MLVRVVISVVVIGLVGCHSSGPPALPGPARHAVGGTVVGLAGAGLVLQNGGGDDLPVTSNGAFTFLTSVPEGGKYAVTIKTQPNAPAPRCAVFHGEGTVGPTDFTGVLVRCEQAIYFTADDGIHGHELWRTDGTAAGTRLIADICPGTCTSYPFDFAASNGLLLFSADDGIHGRELWRSDGTSTGTWLVKDLSPGPAGSSPSAFTVLGDFTYFAASDGAHGNGVWRTDGTEAGTTMVKEVELGAYGSRSGFTLLGSALYFVAADGAIWKTDGSGAGTTVVRSFNPAVSFPAGGFTALGDTLIFYAYEQTTGIEVWRTDGTPNGTFLLKDINPGDGSSFPIGFTALGGKLYFRADDGTGTSLWATDGTNAGTARVSRLYPSPMSVPGRPTQFTVFRGSVYFGGSDLSTPGGPGFELWKTDGTPAGTVMLTDTTPDIVGTEPSDLVVVGDVLYFVGTDGARGRQIWRTDGTPGGTEPVEPDRPTSPFASFPLFTPLGDRAVFRAFDEAGEETWSTDGTAAGTGRVLDLFPGPTASSPDGFTAF